ncbi:hypothetical protein [Bradyrhizobium cosmicum]|uniref:Uncharacterized protein n=1 Tax=Bradyrhizobium cosmicum TaxID=1404864 RepID=A0AAI8M8Q9_9BRAD|nr:hypothetical protein [Bradyrhizobium cosmicum]BAL73740.1 hypothetical protein S23_05190 [Bradyrhizobium cosmicum]
MTTRAELFWRYSEFAERYGVEMARRVVAWRGYCASADVRRVQPGVYASLIRSFDDVEAGRDKLPGYAFRFDTQRQTVPTNCSFDRDAITPKMF